MLAEEHILNYGALLGGSCLEADVTRSPALHKHFNVSSHAAAGAEPGDLSFYRRESMDVLHQVIDITEPIFSPG